MKTFILLFVFACSVNAQNFAVRFTGSNTNGIPIYWPIVICGVGTNLTFKSETVLTSKQLDTCIVTNQVAFINAQKAAETTASAAAAKVQTDTAVINLWLLNIAKSLVAIDNKLTPTEQLVIVAKIQSDAGVLITNQSKLGTSAVADLGMK